MATLLERIKGTYLGEDDGITIREISSLTTDDVYKLVVEAEENDDTPPLMMEYNVVITDEEYESLGIKRKEN